MGTFLVIFGIISIIAGASEGTQKPITFGIITVIIGILVSSKKEEAKKKYEEREEEARKINPVIPKREKTLEDIDLRETKDSAKIMNRFKNNDFCKTILRELTEEDLYKSIEVYEDKIVIGKKKYIYEDYGLRELELDDTSVLANFLGMNLTKDSSYLVERIKEDLDIIKGYRVYKNK